jgi:hypothetical protein
MTERGRRAPGNFLERSARLLRERSANRGRPVKETLRITGDAIMAAEICAASPQITFTTPGGIPASSQHFAIAYA